MRWSSLDVSSSTAVPLCADPPLHRASYADRVIIDTTAVSRARVPSLGACFTSRATTDTIAVLLVRVPRLGACFARLATIDTTAFTLLAGPPPGCQSRRAGRVIIDIVTTPWH